MGFGKDRMDCHMLGNGEMMLFKVLEFWLRKEFDMKVSLRVSWNGVQAQFVFRMGRFILELSSKIYQMELEIIFGWTKITTMDNFQTEKDMEQEHLSIVMEGTTKEIFIMTKRVGMDSNIMKIIFSMWVLLRTIWGMDWESYTVEESWFFKGIG